MYADNGTYDGVSELWFDDLDAMASTDPDVVRASSELLEDERNSIDLSRRRPG